jgi:cyclic beta-1,2-glucan synthetase
MAGTTNPVPRILRFLRRPAHSAEDFYAGPIRGELLGADHLAERARALAKGQRPERRKHLRYSARLLNRLDATRVILNDAYERLAAAAREGVDVGPSGEWLLDNFHVVEEHVREVRESLPRDYYRELPQLSAGPLRGYPRVYELAITLISHTEGRIDLENVDSFTAAFQEISPLSIGELWSIPAMLRLGLIESVRRMTLRTVSRLDEIEDADRWAARIHADHTKDPSLLGYTFEEFREARSELTPTFLSRFLQQLRLNADALSPLRWVEQWITERGVSADDAVARATERLALTAHMMSNSITSLRGIAHRDWRYFVEHQSAVERILRSDPAGQYSLMTFTTRDAYRHVIERVAKGVEIDERLVAEKAIELARHSVGSSGSAAAEARRAHVGFYLVDDGVRELEAALGYSEKPGEAVHRWMLRNPNVVFVGGILILTFAAIALVFLLAGDEAFARWLPVLLLTFIPANDIAVNVVNQLVTAFFPPRVLPKLDFERNGVPADCRTVVVVPTLLDSPSAAREAASSLEVQYLANKGEHLHFAILSDFTDADAETRDTDASIVEAASSAIKALNAKYTEGTDDVFYLLHRPRRWNERQGKWMGWERKRGKLSEFNHFLRGGAEGAFSTIVGDVAPIRSARYVITLDSDTLLPPAAAATLIGAIAHPLNSAVYDDDARQVVAGYGILQPRVGVSLASAHRSRFAAVQSGHPGVDPYTTAVSDVYQDLYGEGSFTGKGIYEVDAFEKATRGRFPENRLLSHDLIEGNYARAGLVTDITVFDDYPSRYVAHARRKHRWIRGDWQLLQWLTPRVPGLDGTEPNRLSLLSRWKILDNLRRSVVEIAQLALLIGAWTILPGSPVQWTLLSAGAIAAPWAVAFLLAAIRPPRDKSWRAYYMAVGQDAYMSARQFACALVFLPHHAWLSIDAITRTLWRLIISKRRLLEWQAAALAERSSGGTMRAIWTAMWPAVAMAAVVFAGVSAYTLRATGAGPQRLTQLSVTLVPLTILWIASPWIARVLSRPFERAVAGLSEESRKVALRYARLHWDYFAQFVTEETRWLAPDNFQEDPAPVVAMRTSPTNIGLQLLSTCTAHDLGFISLEEMTVAIERAFESLGRMQRYRGHFYNWYDLHDLRVLEPAYVSTVDSGNLAGHLIALRQACLAYAVRTSTELAPRLVAIAEQAQRFALDMDFTLLFDKSRKLFAIGYNTSTRMLDASSYDLLASEARLASFVAIAKNDVPFEHWFRLGRSLTSAGGDTVLVSWSGSMFEYMMPVLVMHAYPSTVLQHTYSTALETQIGYGAERGVPWGFSESAHNARDRHFTYQYKAFGVPALGLKRGLARDLVVAPYASALAAMVDPERSIANLKLLEGKGALGTYGFHDALDYTRVDPNERYTVVRNYMAHHVGMSVVALANVLLDNRWQKAFHADPAVRSVALLLDERVPRKLDVKETQVERANEVEQRDEALRPVVREIDEADTPEAHIALLGHAPFTVMLNHAGGGYCRYEDIAVIRWRADGTRDRTGHSCYVRDVSRGRVWSTAHQPTLAHADWYHARLATDRVTLHRADGDIDTRTEIVVVPEDSAEVRRVTLSNNSDETREIELTSYAEIVLNNGMADRVHPAFGNLFVETEYHDWCTAITATRRPRSSTDRELWCVHVVDNGEKRSGTTTCETDRARFIGRGRSVRDPIAMEGDGPLSGTTGAVLDPIFSLRTRVKLGPRESACVAFTTLVATTKEMAFKLADRYHHPHSAERALELAWTSTQIELREFDITPADAADFQDLAGRLLYPSASTRVRNPVPPHGSWQQTLWANGISGDWPIVVATVESFDGLTTLQQLFAAHRYWRIRGMTVDLVIIDEHPHSYIQSMKDRITELMLTTNGIGIAEQPGGVFIRRRDQLDPNALTTIVAMSAVRILCDGRSLARVLNDAQPPSDPDIYGEDPLPAPRRGEVVAAGQGVVERFRSRAVRAIGKLRDIPSDVAQLVTGSHRVQTATGLELQFDNGFGGFTAEGNYSITANGDHVPPAPWANVIANEHGGFIVTERGGGFTWVQNSYFYRLTPWHNDPVCDPLGEVLYLRDEATGEIWCPTPAPIRRDTDYRIEHAPGRSTFVHEHEGIVTSLELGVVENEPIKVSRLSITNRTERTRRISVTSYTEWTLGVLREQTQYRIGTWYDAARGAMFARNHFDAQFFDWVAFSAMSEKVTEYSGDRQEFLGRNGSLAYPTALQRSKIGSTTGLGHDPCAALQCVVEIPAGETREVLVILGAAPDDEAARKAVDRYCNLERAKAAVDAGIAAWESRLSVISVRTPEPSLDLVVNRWSHYQALACRMWARSAVYQSSGAYGFRDQLQDCMAFVYAEPAVARAHILRAAARQFQEGDVQHWWHPESGRGVRTRFSDDLAWLPFVVDHYVRVTGDAGILDEQAHFLEMRQLEPYEHEVYDQPRTSENQASVYEHCIRAIRKACTVGVHGLPLIGGGDWNDGMNRVGVEGRGESVWLAWFLITTLRRFAELCDARNDGDAATDFRAKADAYAAAAEAHAWDGEWYRRAFFDDGAMLGSAANAECRIDSIAQSWSVISGAGRPERQHRAMASLEEHLVREDARLLMLLAPPFHDTPLDPGYIKGYVPGVRENGAQYTHAALWAVLAAAASGDGERAVKWFQMINPITHADSRKNAEIYKVEPYVVAADVYTATGSLGRGGWTWYTGSASWMYRVGLEAILGFRKSGSTLRIEPCVPASWPELSIEYRFGSSVYAITVESPGQIRRAGASITVDGQEVTGDAITLEDDGMRRTVGIRPRSPEAKGSKGQ